jgi:nucleotide-binding universal stress UspA family protein
MGDVLKINKILAAIDLGADTEKILAYAEWLSKTRGVDTQIDMLYVIDYAITPPAYLVPYIEEEKRLNEEELKKWAEKLNSLGIKTGHAIAAGRLIETFNTAIKEMDTDMLVLGYKSHIVRPSSSERMIKSLDIPMLVVRGKKSEGACIGGVGINRILCAVDFSEPSKRALEVAKSLSEKSSSELIVTHIISSLKVEKVFEKWKGMTEKDKSSYSNELIKNAEEEMCSFLQVCGEVGGVVRIGIPYATINDIAMERDADMIVMGARGLSYTKGVILGSVSESVIKSSPCPVMIVR